MNKHAKNSSEATLWQFKMVINTGDVRYLIKIDNYDELPEDVDYAELSNAWYRIYNEFSDVAGGNRADLGLLQVKRLTTMKIRIATHFELLKAISIFPDKELIDYFNTLGYAIDPDNFNETYNAAHRKLTHEKHKASGIEKDMEDDDQKSETDLDDLIVSLEKYQGYQFNEYEMTVRKFANIYKKARNAGSKNIKE